MCHHAYTRYTFVVTYKKEHTGKFLYKLNTAGTRKLQSLLKHKKENWPLKELFMIDWLPARDAKSRSITLYLPTPTFSLSRDFKAELNYKGPEEEARTVSKEVQLYIMTFFEQVGGGLTQAESEIYFVKAH